MNPRERADALTEQARVAVDELFARFGPNKLERRSMARLAWLDGYKAGMQATQTLADEAFARLQAELET